MSYTLRLYQQAAVDSGVGALTDGLPKSPALIVMPPGAGKSLVLSSIGSRLDAPTMVLQPNGEILRQNLAKFRSYEIEPAIWSASMLSKETGQGVTLATIGSVVKHPEAFRHVRYVLVDECHLVNSTGGQYRQFFDASPRFRILGLTATPWRMASNSFGTEQRFLTRTREKTFRRVVHVTQIRDLFRDGYLCPLKYRSVEVFKPAQLVLNSVASDFTDESVRRVLRGSDFDRRLLDGIRTLLRAGRKHVVVFTRFVEEAGGAKAVADELGSDAVVVHAEMTASARRKALERWKSGEVKVAVNVGVIALGVDFPALEAAVIATPMASLGKWYQMCGRVVRTHPDKPFAEIVDLCGNLRRFGKIEDLVLRPGGAKGDLWAFWSNGRQMTNKITPAPDTKAAKRVRFWSSAAGQARRTGGIRGPLFRQGSAR